MLKNLLIRLSIAVLLTLTYVGAGKLGLSFAFINPSASAVWAPTGIAIGALLVFGYRLWPAIFIGALVVNMTTSGSLGASFLIAMGNTIEGLMGAYLVTRFARGRLAFERAQDITKFVFFAGMAATAVSATVGITALYLNGLAAADQYSAVWFTWWLGDATGALLVTPVLVLWANPNPGARMDQRRTMEVFVLLTFLFVFALTVVGNFLPGSLQHYPLEFVSLPIVVWCAFRFGQREAATAIAILSVVAVWRAVYGFGPFTHYDPGTSLLLLQLFMAIVSLNGLFLAALVAERRSAQTLLRDREEQYRIVTETASDVIITIDQRNIITFANTAAEKIFGYQVRELLGCPLTTIMPEYRSHVHKTSFQNWGEAGEWRVSWSGVELTGLHKDGHTIPLEISFSEFKQAGKHVFTGVIRDITERKRALASQRLLATIVESSNDAIIGKTPDGIIISWNQAAERMYGYASAEAVGQPISMLVPPDRFDEVPQLLERLRRGESIEHYETKRIRKDRSRLTVSLTISPIKDEAGNVVGASSVARDITDRKQAEEALQQAHVDLERRVEERTAELSRVITTLNSEIAERKHAEEHIRYMAQHDTLTGLPNRALFRDCINQAIAQARRDLHRAAILFLDLDDFKHINDSLGHQIGDRLLRSTARRLQGCLREQDAIARLGGDEFVIGLPILREDSDAIKIAEKILETLRDPFVVDQHQFHISGSIGISIYPTDGEDVETLMRAADTAMYHAKEKGRNNYQFFTSRLNDVAQRRLVVANRLHQALERREFVLCYQPQVDMETGRVIGTEALLRWQQPGAGLILPGEFIKVAEETGMIMPLGEWVLRQACFQLSGWHKAGHTDLRMAVNVSPHQFRRPGFPELVLRTLRESGLPPSALQLELTEGILTMHSTENLETLQQLANQGVQLAVDDFGTGYSSLSYLQRFPVRSLKIDRSFVNGIGSDQNDTTIVATIIAMANTLKLALVAEGVETAEQAMFLKANGCTVAQGYYYSHAVSAEAFSELLGTPLRIAPKA